jgi:hypothetical protein
MVPVKDRACLMPCDLHCDSFRNSCSYHIPYRCPSKIVRYLTRQSRFRASTASGFVKREDPLPAIVEHPGVVWVAFYMVFPLRF